MDYTSITAFISSVGFPIVACIVMFKQNGELQKTLAELSNTLSCMNERLSDVESAVKKGE